jgi:hypothetical protein
MVQRDDVSSVIVSDLESFDHIVNITTAKQD